jgi:hypothetical protein
MGLFRHAGLDPASRDPKKNWIPAFAGMTKKRQKAIYKQTLIRVRPQAAFPPFV